MKKILHRKLNNGDSIEITVSNDGTNPKNRYWSVQAEVKSPGSRVVHSCGCMHDAVLEAAPELKPFVDLHLSNLKGVPMHAVANAHYFATQWQKAVHGLDVEEREYNRKPAVKWMEILCGHLMLDKDLTIKLAEEMTLSLQKNINEVINKFIEDNGLVGKWYLASRKATEILENMKDEPEPKLPEIGLEFTSELKHTLPNGARTFNITLRKNRRSMTVEYTQGSAITEDPTLDNVMESLAGDVRGVEDDPDVEEWAKEYGFEDGYQAHKVFAACRKEYEDLKRVLGDDYERVINMYQP